jgi:GT2 family glycosyltransferase
MTQIIPFISVLIPTFNEEKRISVCLESIFNLKYPHDMFEVIIIDGFSKDRTVEFAEKYPVRILYEKKPTRAAGCNVGVLAAKGEIIAFTDADCTVDSLWLNKLIENYDNPLVGGVGGPNIVMPENDLATKIFSLMKIPLAFGGFRYTTTYHEKREIYHNPGCNSSIRKDVYCKVGMMDEKLLTAEDTELSERIRNEGFKLLYAPDAKIFHHWKFDIKRYFNWMKRYGMGQAQFIIKSKFKFGKESRSPLFLIPSIGIIVLSTFILLGFLNSYFWFICLFLIIIYAIYLIICGIKAERNIFRIDQILKSSIVLIIGQIAWGIGVIISLIKNFNVRGNL